MLFILIALTLSSKNPVIFTFGPDNLYDKKVSAITGNILLDIVDNDIWRSLFEGEARFRLVLSVDKEGNILSLKNISPSIPDSVVNKFMDIFKKNNTELYVYVSDIRYKDKINYVKEIVRLNPPYMVLLYFPGNLLWGEKKSGNKRVPSRDEIRDLCKKYLDVPLITSQSLELNRLLIND